MAEDSELHGMPCAEPGALFPSCSHRSRNHVVNDLPVRISRGNNNPLFKQPRPLRTMWMVWLGLWHPPSNGILTVSGAPRLVMIGGENNLGCPAETGAEGQTDTKL